MRVCVCVCVYIYACICVSVSNIGQVIVILMTIFLFTNDIFDCFIYFVVIFCGIRLFLTENLTNFN